MLPKKVMVQSQIQHTTFSFLFVITPELSAGNPKYFQTLLLLEPSVFIDAKVGEVTDALFTSTTTRQGMVAHACSVSWPRK